MKKLWIVLLVILLMVFSFAMAQEIHWANQITVAWDAPGFLVDGSPIPVEDAVAYNMYLRPDGATTEPYVSTTPDLIYTYTLPEGIHEAGVSAIRFIGGVGEPLESDIVWSKDADPPFLLGYGRIILWDAETSNFRVQ